MINVLESLFYLSWANCKVLSILCSHKCLFRNFQSVRHFQVKLWLPLSSVNTAMKDDFLKKNLMLKSKLFLWIRNWKEIHSYKLRLTLCPTELKNWKQVKVTCISTTVDNKNTGSTTESVIEWNQGPEVVFSLTWKKNLKNFCYCCPGQQFLWSLIARVADRSGKSHRKKELD